MSDRPAEVRLPRVGLGWDVHRLSRRAGKPLVLAGVPIDDRRGSARGSSRGPVAHSDGDVLIHALIDALLGAAALPDIGRQFPPDDPQYRGISSRLLLRRTLEMVSQAGFRPANVDCTVVLQAPRLAPHMPHLRANLAADLGLPEQRVSVKAKTAEGLGAVGRRRAVEAWAVALLEPLPAPSGDG